ncbi:MAG: oxaloacetate decarboxylase [Ruminococcaceae bacterium]|nr:oxaloacetate decarboxylase [Oscillospiraceae bacterium]
MNITPFNFILNLRYMGIGMLSIFIVIGIVMLVTVILNKITKGE